jgi:hypothetical protein
LTNSIGIFVHLSTSHREAQRPTFAVDNDVDFRGPTTPTDTDRLIFVPPRPLAEPQAFTTVERDRDLI